MDDKLGPMTVPTATGGLKEVAAVLELMANTKKYSAKVKELSDLENSARAASETVNKALADLDTREADLAKRLEAHRVAVSDFETAHVAKHRDLEARETACAEREAEADRRLSQARTSEAAAKSLNLETAGKQRRIADQLEAGA